MAMKGFRNEKKKQNGLAAMAGRFFKKLFTDNQPEKVEVAKKSKAPTRWRMARWMRVGPRSGVSAETQRWLRLRAYEKRHRKNQKRLLDIALGGWDSHYKYRSHLYS